MSEEIRVFLCDDVREFRALLRFGLEEDPDVEVVGEAGDGESGIAGVERTKPDVVLLDLSMPRCDGLEALPRIRAVAPGACIIALSGFGADRMERICLEAGAHRYLMKGCPLEDVRAAVRECVSDLRAA